MSDPYEERPGGAGSVPAELGETTNRLLIRVNAGDRSAADELFARYAPRLRRWATGRLPRWARDIADTHDLVQDALLQTCRNLETFTPEHPGAFQAYLRQAVLNRIRDELRRHARRPSAGELPEHIAEDAPSPLELAIGRRNIERYERALARLRPIDREAIIARVEMGCSFEEVADALGKPSAVAARKATERALVRLAEEMHRDRR